MAAETSFDGITASDYTVNTDGVNVAAEVWAIVAPVGISVGWAASTNNAWNF